MGVDDPIEMQRLGEQLPIERAASRFIVSTDPDEHVERIARYIDMGFRHLVFHDPGHDQEEFLRMLRRRDPAAAARTVRPGRQSGADGRARPGWAVIIPVKPAARRQVPARAADASTASTLARAIALDTIAAAAACAVRRPGRTS